jgi:hypothetical protein
MTEAYNPGIVGGSINYIKNIPNKIKAGALIAAVAGGIAAGTILAGGSQSGNEVNVPVYTSTPTAQATIDNTAVPDGTATIDNIVIQTPTSIPNPTATPDFYSIGRYGGEIEIYDSIRNLFLGPKKDKLSEFEKILSGVYDSEDRIGGIYAIILFDFEISQETPLTELQKGGLYQTAIKIEESLGDDAKHLEMIQLRINLYPR